MKINDYFNYIEVKNESHFLWNQQINNFNDLISYIFSAFVQLSINYTEMNANLDSNILLELKKSYNFRNNMDLTVIY